MFDEERGAGGDRAVGIECGAAAVEDEFVLSADQVAEEEGGVECPGGGGEGCFAFGAFAAVVGRGGEVDHQIGVTGGESRAGGSVGEPGVFADVNADTGAEGIEGEGFGSGGEDSLFIEHAVVGQHHFSIDAEDAAGVKNDGGIEASCLVGRRRADDDEGVGGQSGGKLLQMVFAVGNKMRAQDEVFGRVAAESELGKNDQPGAGAGGALGVGKDPRGVFLECADGGVHLNQRCTERVHQGIMALAAAAPSGFSIELEATLPAAFTVSAATFPEALMAAQETDPAVLIGTVNHSCAQPLSKFNMVIRAREI